MSLVKPWSYGPTVSQECCRAGKASKHDIRGGQQQGRWLNGEDMYSNTYTWLTGGETYAMFSPGLLQQAAATASAWYAQSIAQQWGALAQPATTQAVPTRAATLAPEAAEASEREVPETDIL
eukprot:s3000_g21.t1